jgi:hypothetical protein
MECRPWLARTGQPGAWQHKLRKIICAINYGRRLGEAFIHPPFFLKKILSPGIFPPRPLYVCLTAANNPSKKHQACRFRAYKEVSLIVSEP